MVRILGCMGIIAALTACATPVLPGFDPVVATVVVQDKPFIDGFATAELRFDVLLRNPNRVAVELTDVEWELRVGDGQTLASGQLEASLSLEDRASRVYEVTVPVDLVELRALDIEGLHDGTSWVVELGADNRTADGEGVGRTTVEAAGDLDVPIPPKIELRAIEVLDPGDGDTAWARVRIDVVNDNPRGPLFFQDIDWQLHIDGVAVADNHQAYLVPIHFGDGPVGAELFGDLDFGALGGLEQFLNDQQVSAQLGGSAVVTHPYGTPGPVPLDTTGAAVPVSLACPSAGLYLDADEDGFGDSSAGTSGACWAPGPTSHVGGDCDDTDSEIHPGAHDACDGRDVDCDGVDGNDQVLGNDEICAGGVWELSTGGFGVSLVQATPNPAPGDANGQAVRLGIGSGGDFAGLGTSVYTGLRLSELRSLDMQVIARQSGQPEWQPRIQLYVDWDGPGSSAQPPGKLIFEHGATTAGVLTANQWHTITTLDLPWFSDQVPASMTDCVTYQPCDWDDWVGNNPNAELLAVSSGGDPGLLIHVGPPWTFWDGSVDSVHVAVDKGAGLESWVHDL